MHRELVLVGVLAAIAVGGFFVTRAAADADQRLRERQASMWFERGRQALELGSLDHAVADLRRALARDGDERRYRLALASALVSGGRDREARGILLTLRDGQPDDPEANLQLARLEARAGQPDASRRYYESAVAALWPPEQSPRRRAIRLELIDALLARGERGRALSELLLVGADVAELPPLQLDVGQRFLAAGDPGRARDYFTRVLRVEPANRAALVGAGSAAFALGDYAAARRHLNAVSDADAVVADMREVAEFVVAGDPLAPRLSAVERRRRLAAALGQAARRLDQCSPDTVDASSELRSIHERVTAMTTAIARRSPSRDVVDDGIDLVHRIELAAERECGVPPSTFDRALLLIGRRHGFEDA